MGDAALLCALWCVVKETGLGTDLGEQRRGGGAEVVGDEQLGVGVDPCWVELPQWLVGQEHREQRGRQRGTNSLVARTESTLLTIPVRSSNSSAPRLHQSHASVALDTPPISASAHNEIRSALLNHSVSLPHH